MKIGEAEKALAAATVKVDHTYTTLRGVPQRDRAARHDGGVST